MFPAHYFPDRYFAPRYFGVEGAESLDQPGIRVDIAGQNILYDDPAGFRRGLHLDSNASWNLMVGSRGTCDLPIAVPPGDDFAPSVENADQIDIYEVYREDPIRTQRVWTGNINSIKIKFLTDSGWKLMSVSGTTPESQLDTAQTDQHYIGMAPDDIANDLLTASGADVAVGTIETGADILSLPVTRISDGLTETAKYTGGMWYVNPEDRSLNLHAMDSRPHSRTITNLDIRWGTLEFSQSADDFRERQIIQGPSGRAEAGSGNRAQRRTISSTKTLAGLQQEVDAALANYQTKPSAVVFESDTPGYSIGQLVTFDIDPSYPVGADALLNGDWLLIEVEAHHIGGTENLPEPYGHFRYTYHWVNSATIQNFVQAAENLANTGPMPDPDEDGTGQLYVAPLFLKVLTVGDDIADHWIVQHAGTGRRITAELKLAITVDLEVTLNVNGSPVTSITVPNATAVGTVLEFPFVTGSPATDVELNDKDLLTWDITASDGQSDVNGVATINAEWQG